MNKYKKRLIKKDKELRDLKEYDKYSREYIQKFERELGAIVLEVIEAGKLLKDTVWNISTTIGFGRYYNNNSYDSLVVGETSLKRDLYLNPLKKLTDNLLDNGWYKMHINLLDQDVILNISCWHLDEPCRMLETLEVHAEANMYFMLDKDYPQNRIDSELSMKLVLALVDRFEMKISKESVEAIRKYQQSMYDDAEKLIKDIEKRI